MDGEKEARSEDAARTVRHGSQERQEFGGFRDSLICRFTI